MLQETKLYPLMANLNIIKVSDEDADKKYEEFKNVDPFTNIPCALLNSADIINYVEKVALINPFCVSEESLKPASCSIRIEGKYIYWESKEKMVAGSLDKEDDFFILKRN